MSDEPGLTDAVDEAMDLPTEARFYALPIVAAAYPIIAAAVRADERAKVLAEVDAEIRNANPEEGKYAPDWHRALRWALRRVRALNEPSTP